MNDILLSIDGRGMDNVAGWIGRSIHHTPGVPMKMDVLRGSSTLQLQITAVEREEPSDRLNSLSDLTRSQIAQLGILAITLDERVAASMGRLRFTSGVVVIARVRTPEGAFTDLKPGDLIHELNGTSVYSVDNLKAALLAQKSGAAVALLIERAGQLFYVTFDMP